MFLRKEVLVFFFGLVFLDLEKALALVHWTYMQVVLQNRLLGRFSDF